jgi:hypothetical protein
MIMFIKVSQLMAISLLCLVGCTRGNGSSNELAFPEKTSVTESDLSGCCSQSLGVGGTLLKSTYILQSGGNYTRRSKYIVGPPEAISRPEAVFFGKWMIDNEYVIIQESQEDTEKTITLKVISNYELRLLGSSSNAVLLRC